MVRIVAVGTILLLAAIGKGEEQEHIAVLRSDATAGVAKAAACRA